MSEFECNVVKIESKERHPNADTLSITEIDGNPVIVRTDDFQVGDLAVYLPIESVIPQGREWVEKYCSHLRFKSGVHRLRAIRLRGIFSMGMLVPIGALGTGPTPGRGKDGTDVAEVLGVTKYEEPEERVPHVQGPPRKRTALDHLSFYFFRFLGLFGYRRKPKARLFPIYDLGNYRKAWRSFKDGEEVVATEKIHGQNFAATYHKGKLVVSSHKVIRGAEDDSNFWRVARELKLAEKLAGYPGLVFYGEIFGQGVQDLAYGVPPGKLEVRFFDVYDLNAKEFLDYDDLQNLLGAVGLFPVPLIYRGPHDHDTMYNLSMGDSTVDGAPTQIREGIVIRRARGQRCVLKLVGEQYLLRAGGSEKH